MTVAAGSICFACKRWLGGICEAFLDGIPESILFDGFDHRQPHEGDNGLLFVLGDPDELDAYEQMKATIATFKPPEVFPEQVKALAFESGFAEEVARVETKHGDKGEPGYELLHPGRTKLVPTEGAEAVFKRPVKGTRFERPSYDEWIPDLVDTDHASYVKGKVGVALRARIRAMPGYKETLDTIPEVELMRMGVLPGGFPRKRMDFNKDEDYKAFLRKRWAASAGGHFEGHFDDAWAALEAKPFEVLPEGSVEDMEREVKLAVLTRHFIDQWASSSGDSDPYSIAVQRRLSEWTKAKFGQPAGDIAPLRKYADASVIPGAGEGMMVENSAWKRSEEPLALFGSFLDLFFDAQYDETQQAFKENGIKVVKLHRGMVFGFKKAPLWMREDYLAKNPLKYEDGQLLPTKQSDTLPIGKVSEPSELSMNPASSWSTSSIIATGFERGGDASAHITHSFPVERILATAGSGIGALNEAEMVVLGYPFVTDDIAWRVSPYLEELWRREADKNAKTTS